MYSQTFMHKKKNIYIYKNEWTFYDFYFSRRRGIEPIRALSIPRRHHARVLRHKTIYIYTENMVGIII